MRFGFGVALRVSSPVLLLAVMGLAGAPAQAAPPAGYDAGLNMPFDRPAPPSGDSVNVLDHGATPDNPSDDDAVAIQRAIDSAAPGAAVFIPVGVYHVKSTVELKSGVSLVGESRDATILAGAYSSSPRAVISAAPGVKDLTLSSFTIARDSGDVYNAGVHLGRVGGEAISRVIVRDLRIENHRRFGVMLQNTDHVLVEDNVVRNASALDGGGSGYGITIDQPGSNNNWVRNNSIGPVIRHAILVQESAHHNLIENNTITGAVSGAIDLHGEDEYSNEIRYNTISDCVRDGTSVSPNGAGIEVGEYSGVVGTDLMHDNSGPNNWIHHNEVSNCTYGLRVVNNSNYTYIEDNVFRNNLRTGIRADLAPMNNLHIARNKIFQNGDGIILRDVTRAVVTDNSITENEGYGIQANAGVVDYLIADNTVVNNKIDVQLDSPNGVFSPSAIS